MSIDHHQRGRGRGQFRLRTVGLFATAAIVGSTLVATATADPASAAPSNFVANGGFETGTLSSWSTWSSGSGAEDYAEAAGSRFGSYHGTHYSASAYQVYTSQLVTGLANGTYTVSALVRSGGGQNSASLTVKSYGGSNLVELIPATTGSGWVPITIPDVMVTTGQLEVGIWSDGNAGNWLHFDEVRIERIAAPPGASAPGTNLILNPGFESGASGWNLSGSSSVSTTSTSSGSSSLRVGPASGFAYRDISSGFAVGSTYVLSAEGRSDTQGATGFIGVQMRNSSNTVLYDAKIPFFDDSFGLNSTTFVVPTGTTSLRAYAYKEDGSNEGFVYLDDLVLYAAAGTTYFVDADNGSDGAAGTSVSSAWRTLEKVAMTDLNPGDSVLLQGGDTFSGTLDVSSDSSGSTSHPITISSYGSGRATISSSGGHGIYLQDSSGIHIYNLDIVGPGSSTAVYNGIKAANNSASTQRGLIGIDNVTVEGFYLGIQIYGDRGRGFGPVNLLNSTTRDNFREGTNVFGYDSAGRAGNVWYSQGLFERVYAGYITSHDNLEWSGILVANTQSGMIEHSLAYNIGEDALPNEGPVGIWTIGCDECTVQFNTAHNVHSSADKLDGDGFDVSNNNTNTLYQYNYAYDNEGPGILVDNYNVTNPANNSVVVRYNVSQANCTDNLFCGEFYIYGEVWNTYAYNNTLIATESTAAVVRVAGEYASSAGNPGSTNAVLRNNILSAHNGAELVRLTEDGEGGLDWGDAGSVSFQGNLYWANGGTWTISDKGSAVNSIAAWRSAGQEMNGATSLGVSSSPSLVAPTTIGDPNNAKITSGSAARDAGLDLPSLFGTSVGVLDFYGGSLPVNSVYDIGAHEYR